MIKLAHLVWLLVIIVGVLLSLAYAVGWLSLPFFFVVEGIVITLAAGLQRLRR